MAKQFYLTEKDRETIVGLIRSELHGYGNPRRDREHELDGYAPDLYIIKVPTDGIPKREGTTPGKAECELFKLQAADEVIAVQDREYELTAVMQVDGSNPLKIWVFNIYPSKISKPSDSDSYIKVQRDKFGTWLAERATAGGAKAIVKVEDVGPMRFDPDNPFDLQGYLADVELAGDPEWAQLLESDECITPEEPEE